MEKLQVKIKRIFEKREGESQRGKWCYQDLHVVEDTDERYPNEFLVTVGTNEVEQVAKLKENDTVKIGLSFFVRECETKDGKKFNSQSVTGWGIEVVQLSAF
jgi:hypothetical protein